MDISSFLASDSYVNDFMEVVQNHFNQDGIFKIVLTGEEQNRYHIFKKLHLNSSHITKLKLQSVD